MDGLIIVHGHGFCSRPDSFWELSGGGFGVQSAPVTALKFCVFPVAFIFEVSAITTLQLSNEEKF
jgi:hypothetical protein